MSRKQKLTIRLGLIGAYFLVWFSFGVAFKLIADRTSGSAFLFQEDLRINSQAAELSRRLGRKVSLQRARDVIKHDAGDRFMLTLASPKGTFSNEVIGRHWSLLYRDLLEAQGITHYKLIPLPHGRYPIAHVLRGQGIYVMTADFPKSRLSEPACRPYRLELYRGEPGVLPTRPEELRAYKLSRVATVWFAGEPINIGDNVLLQPIFFFAEAAQNSINFIDDTPEQLRRIRGGHYRFPLADFLYFSAITIATVGYGDILPNMTAVRVLVMVESLLGVVLIGAFVSSWFMK